MKCRLLCRVFALFAASVLPACRGSGDRAQTPTPMPANSANVRLELGNTSGEDDDPSLVHGLDGAYYLVFLSDRSGNKDLWASRSLNGLEWSTPLRVTHSTDEDLFPALLQTGDGMFHLCWHRFAATTGGTDHIYCSRSTDGQHWNPADEVPVTQGLVDDRVGSMLAVGASELRVYFSSAQRSPGKLQYNDDLFVVRSMDGGATWGMPTLLAGASSDTEEDAFPFVAQTGPGQFTLAFTRQQSADMFDRTSDIFLSTSVDGLTFETPEPVTVDPGDQVHDLWPNLIYAPLAQAWYLSWTSTRFAVGGIVMLPLGNPMTQPTDLYAQKSIAGWSTRVAGSVMVWVNSTAGKPQLWATVNPI